LHKLDHLANPGNCCDKRRAHSIATPMRHAFDETGRRPDRKPLLEDVERLFEPARGFLS
jgi:hypothetical protein